MPSVIFFGSFQHYSTLVLQELVADSRFEVRGVVTTPPMPVGRQQILTQTPVHQWAESHGLPVFTPTQLDNENLKILTRVGQPDFLIVAGYGKIIPDEWLAYPKIAPLNLHFSLLPRWRGANPAEWAILAGDSTSGVSLIKMAAKLDAGDLLATSPIPVEPADSRESLYQKLYEIGGQVLPEMIFTTYDPATQNLVAAPQASESPTPYAALFKRDDGFIPWATIQKAIQNQSLNPDDFPNSKLKKAYEYALTQSPSANRRTLPSSVFIERAVRALYGFPGIWTIVNTVKGEKRLKIHQTAIDNQQHLKLLTVQMEGLKPASFDEIKNQITA